MIQRYLFIALMICVEISYASQNLERSLLSAVKSDDLAQIKDLIARGANVDYRDETYKDVEIFDNYIGNTALIIASRRGNLPIVRELIKAGADVNLQDMVKLTALIYASEEGHLEIVEELIKVETDPLLNKHSKYRLAALMIARSKGHTEVVKFLEQFSCAFELSH